MPITKHTDLEYFKQYTTGLTSVSENIKLLFVFCLLEVVVIPGLYYSSFINAFMCFFILCKPSFGNIGFYILLSYETLQYILNLMAEKRKENKESSSMSLSQH